MHVRRLVAWASLAFTGLLASACDVFSSPQNTFSPAGVVADDQRTYFFIVMWPALVIMLLVLGAIVFIAVRFRRGKGDPGLPKQVHGNTPLELTWTVLPALLMAALAIPTVAGIRDLGREPTEDAFRVNVTGVQWAWLFEYPGVDVGGAPLQGEINEVRIPVDQEIGFYIYSSDVNHSFWIPRLAGKVDAINNHENYMWLRATETGTFEAQCAEFCGLAHADMRFRVVVMEQDDFDEWLDEQAAAARAGAASGVVAGE
jgi:cytochrome c oxidase subunit 2